MSDRTLKMILYNSKSTVQNRLRSTPPTRDSVIFSTSPPFDRGFFRLSLDSKFRNSSLAIDSFPFDTENRSNQPTPQPQIMFGFALILFLVSPVAFLAGLVNPKWVLLGKNKTRLKSSALYSGTFVISFVAVGLTAPPQAKNTSIPKPSIAPSPVAKSSPSVAASISPSVAPSPDAANPSSQPPAKTVAATAKETTNWSDELCQGDRYFPAKGASTAQYNSCQYIKSDSLKPETIVLATGKDSENVADSMVDKGFKKVDWKDGFNPIANQPSSACIVYEDKSVACHKGQGSNRSSNEAKELQVQTASSTSVASDEAVLIAGESESQINLRANPSANSESLGYGLVGDRVQIIEQITVDGYTWHKVRFPRSGAVGWIRGDFLSVASANKTPQPSPEVTTYAAPKTTTSGRCNSPDDLDSRGRRCGGRARNR